MKNVTRAILAAAAVLLLASCMRRADSEHQQQLQAEALEGQIRTEQHAWHLRWLARAQVLNELTPDQRTLVGQIIGQMAVAPDPNVSAAIKELDKTLTPAEKKAVLETSAWLRKQVDYPNALRKSLLAADPLMRFSTRHYMHEDPAATVLILTTNSIALRTSLAARGSAQP